MINNFFKTINIKYSRIIKFIFFLRYLFGVFFLSITLFLIIPKFFDYEKKANIIKNHLLDSYNLDVNSYQEINYYFFPKPKIEIKKTDVKFPSIDSNLLINKIIMYPKILSIYNYDNFDTYKIVLNESKSKLEILDINAFFKNILDLKKKIYFKKLDLELTNNDKLLVKLEKIYFSNYGYNKNVFLGKIFEKKFKLELSDKLNSIKFLVPKIGFLAEIETKNKNKNIIEGNVQLKLINTNLKFDFLYSDKKIEIKNSYFRNKNLSFKNKSKINLIPFFYLDTNFEVEDLNFEYLKKIDFSKLLENKNIIGKINSKSVISYKPKKFSRNIFDELNLTIDLAYGKLIFEKEILIKNTFFKCDSDINLFDELPILTFNCQIFSDDKRNFLKIFSIKKKNKKQMFNLKVVGKVNILNNKIFFNSITNDNYIASKEDLKYFKNTFENILFDESFFKILNLKKIKKFILEVS